MRLVAFLCLSLALPALTISARADDLPPPGAVDRLIGAHRLMAMGMATRDGLSQIAAARLVAGLEVQRVGRQPELAGTAPPGTDTAPDARPGPMELDAMIETARHAVEADESLSWLLQSSLAGAEALPKAVLRQSDAVLEPGQSHEYRLPVDGGAALEIGLVGDGGGALSLSVKGEVGKREGGTGETGLLCLAPEAPAACRVTLSESGFVAVTIGNAGPETHSYWLVTN
ncbi:MAG: hypothetical protein LBE86_11275 [Gemmobacter sp.]|jgi:hypothetical protein|nr:hypothetical protein [Gemmobacter sp.]